MKKTILSILIIFRIFQCEAQSMQFTFSDSTILPLKPAGLLHGISAIEYIPSKKQWHLASDRGNYFVFDSIQNIRDFDRKSTASLVKNNWSWFESVRYDAMTGNYFYAIENEYKANDENTDTTTWVSVYESFPPTRPNPFYLVPPMPLPADNKGIEAIAVTENGNVWVAPEVGWKGETEVGNDTIHFLKFYRDSHYEQLQTYSYVIDRSGCPYGTVETRGGISEILTVSEDELLVLERCFDEGNGGTNKIKAKLWKVTADGQHLKKDPAPAFDFNAGMKFVPDNLEGMAWWPSENGKRKLVVISDDNPGAKNKQRTQIILLEEKESAVRNK
ncbi:esterase-like activity of phytase family protein [Dyadobacter sediminis]|uniref:Esterase-like activity of phytase family protein n=1 Tax=Dyadobacter sediminis TaxID=1493691 RepID=A0A5R9KKT9_9BACT|nr:esterase-like activity of phytase family protein [Dyadobacter sediminis]TLU96804.1 esterase-like activity of phytase family protein [Dyadobacter sediminis]GGB85284.1 hypothetical protein GCM10011325_11100 [Dyadobacter sediminis]